MKQRIALSIILFFLSGCNHSSFYTQRASKREAVPVHLEQGKKIVRSITMYEQFELIGRFAALWLHYSIEPLGNKNHIKPDTISFYVLSLSDVHFNEPLSQWQVGLKINDQFYQPITIQRTSLPSVYQSLFGPHFAQYKAIYLIEFNAVDERGIVLLQPNTSMKLEISFEDRPGHMVWNFNERAVLLPHFETHCRRGN